MAENPPQSYGVDIACPTNDADELFSEATGLDVLMQDIVHLITCDDFLGPGGDGRGFDVRRLLGMADSELASMQPILEDVIRRDDRILDATVELSSTVTASDLADVVVKITCTSQLGPFSFTKPVSQLTEADLESQVS